MLYWKSLRDAHIAGNGPSHGVPSSGKRYCLGYLYKILKAGEGRDYMWRGPTWASQTWLSATESMGTRRRRAKFCLMPVRKACVKKKPGSQKVRGGPSSTHLLIISTLSTCPPLLPLPNRLPGTPASHTLAKFETSLFGCFLSPVCWPFRPPIICLFVLAFCF